MDADTRTMRFMHIADVHLGYQQYGLKERFNDFSRVFLSLMDQAVEQEVDFVLLAGDLFEKRTVDPLAMRVAIAGFEQLQAANIPVLAIEGNHEKAYYHEQYSWMDFLDALGYLKLLNPTFKEGHATLEPHSEDGGAYVDLPGGVRVYGIKYYGASISQVVEAFTRSLQEIDHSGVNYAILMLHAGLEGQIANTGRLKYNDLAPLRDYIDYIALGHIHKPYMVEDWLYNPGSPETNSMEEASWPDRGCYLVDILPGQSPPHRARMWPTTGERRPFYSIRLKTDALVSPDAVYDAVRRVTVEKAERVERKWEPIVEVTLSGVLPFNRYELDLDYVQNVVEEAWEPLQVRVRNQTTPTEFQVDITDEVSRPDLERAVVRDLLARDIRYRPAADEWAKGALELKRLALEGGDVSGAVIDHLRRLRNQIARNQIAGEGADFFTEPESATEEV